MSVLMEKVAKLETRSNRVKEDAKTGVKIGAGVYGARGALIGGGLGGPKAALRYGASGVLEGATKGGAVGGLVGLARKRKEAKKD